MTLREPSLHEAIHTLRAMRRLRPDPVSDEDLRYVIDAAIRAPNAENRQRWSFVAVRDPERRRALGAIYARLGREHIGPGLAAARSEEERRVYRSALRFADRLGEAPALIVCCMEGPRPTRGSAVEQATWYGSIFPAIQNLLLAARARGLGTVLTTLHLAAEEEVKRLLDIPDGVATVALVPIGHPEGRFDEPRRRPARDALHWDRWGHR